MVDRIPPSPLSVSFTGSLPAAMPVTAPRSALPLPLVAPAEDGKPAAGYNGRRSQLRIISARLILGTVPAAGRRQEACMRTEWNNWNAKVGGCLLLKTRAAALQLA